MLIAVDIAPAVVAVAVVAVVAFAVVITMIVGLVEHMDCIHFVAVNQKQKQTFIHEINI